MLKLLITLLSLTTILNGAQSELVTVSGMSSGGAMATQLHVAFSSIISGSGSIAGPPYACSGGSVLTATTTCMNGITSVNVNNLVAAATNNQNLNSIDDVKNLKNHRVYLYSSPIDYTVKTSVVQKGAEFFKNYMSESQIKTVYSYSSAHGMITNFYGGSCSVSNDVHINNCDYNQAYDILNHLYPNDNIVENQKGAQLSGILTEFDQTEFFPAGSASSISMDDTGYVYIPKSCIARNQKCKVHVALHGCGMGKYKIGDAFAANSGYNQVADLNNIIIVYPQAKANLLTNPNGCWDWWGYTDSSYATKNGKQMKAILGIISKFQNIDGIQVTVTNKPTQQQTVTSTSTSASVTNGQATNNQQASTNAPIVVVNNGKLQKFNSPKSKVTVSGISSGGAMATQLHVAYSSLFSGSGTIAGPPYTCSGGQVANALTTCMSSTGSSINLNTIYSTSNNYYSQKSIDSTDNIKNSRVYIFTGTGDTTVKPGVVKRNEEFFKNYMSASNIKTVYNVAAVHGMITNFYGSACGTTGSSYINNCNYNQAFDLLDFLYPNDNVVENVKGAATTGTLMEFDQTEFFPSGSSSTISMDKIGYVYVPKSCLTQECKLHVALHGCLQGKHKIGDIYVKNSGYNQVADINNFIILYPQAINSGSNANGCWDWWGYIDANYANQKGKQMIAIKAMIDRVLSH